MTDKDADLENEHAWLVKLVDSEGWKIFHTKWAGMLEECARQLRAPDCDKRDFYAGLVTGYERLLNYPSTRIASIEKLWKTKNAT